ncbi:MAG: EVE domain-containing protein [Gemmataceae bacterium]
MPCWLFKEEPDHYNYADLERDGETWWDGVDNNWARQHLRQVRAGDRILFYHTGKEKAIVGEMVAVSDPQADSRADDPKAVVVRVRAARRWPIPLPLRRIKMDTQLADWELVRLPRLSVLPVSEAQWQRLEQLAQEDDNSRSGR